MENFLERRIFWSDWVKNARKKLGKLTQLQLAEKLREKEKTYAKVFRETDSKERVAKVEQAQRSMSLDMYLDICEMIMSEKEIKMSKEELEDYKPPYTNELEWWDITHLYETIQKSRMKIWYLEERLYHAHFYAESRNKAEWKSVGRKIGKLEKEIERLQLEKSKYINDDPQICLPILSDKEKIKKLIAILLENDIEVPEECKF